MISSASCCCCFVRFDFHLLFWFVKLYEESLFIKIRTDEGHLVSIPNNILLQKQVRIDGKKRPLSAEKEVNSDKNS